MPLLALALTLVTLWGLLLVAGARYPAIGPMASLARSALLTPGGRLGLTAVAAVLLFNVYETHLDPQIAPALGLDFTPWLLAVEGDAVIWLQRSLRGHQLAVFWAWVYVFLYPCLVALPTVIYHDRRDGAALRSYVAAFALNYFLALPFYLFVPVTETGWSEPRTADAVLENALPGWIEFLRSSSALDNCFPSLHVSLTATAALHALRWGPRRLALTAGAGSVLVIASTLALGIHWIADGVAGVGMAALAVRLAPQLGRWVAGAGELHPRGGLAR